MVSLDLSPGDTTLGVGIRQTPLPTAAIVGKRYRVETMIGGGGCGLVYAGRHEILGKSVAIKMLRPELVRDPAQAQRFFREARLAAALHHEHIVDITDFGTDEGSGAPYLVMELLRGRTLMTVMREAGVLAWPRVVSILIQLARALACAHEHGVLHRDLKPHNVMLSESSAGGEQVKLCDFGLSRLRVDDERITSTGSFVGTPAYVAPEQIAGDEQDERGDFYALGVTAYEMLTGTLPYRATGTVSLIAEILSHERVPLRDRLASAAPAGLISLIERLIAREPDERPASASAIERELIAITAGASAPVSDLTGHLVGSYRITGLLGSGGHGSVWLAEHPVIGTKVAIKVLRPEIAAMPGLAERFVNEARAASSIPSPHVARYHDLGRLPSGQPYAIIEYLDGETLAKRLARVVRLPIAETVELARQIAGALDSAHALGIVHRDVKPENVVLAATGAKVLDFGIAKVTGPSGDAAVKTQTGFFMGTIMYCAPEQLLGAEIGPAADVYALGATMFEMLVGHAPFTGDATQIANAKASRAAPPIKGARADVPAHLAELVADMLAHEAARRPTMAAVVERLSASEPARVPSAAASLSRVTGSLRPRRWPLLAIASATVAVAIALAVWPRGADPELAPAIEVMVPDEPPPELATAQQPRLELHVVASPPPAPKQPSPPRKAMPAIPQPASDVIVADPFAEPGALK